MTATWCMAWLVVAGHVTVAQPPDEPPAKTDGKVQTVIDEVEEVCLKRRIRLLAPEKAKRLVELVRQARPRVVVECGTAIGYSSLWIGRELKAAGKGKLVSFEINPQRAKQARANFRKAGLSKFVTVKVGDAKQVNECELLPIQNGLGFLLIPRGQPVAGDCRDREEEPSQERVKQPSDHGETPPKMRRRTTP